MKKFYVAIISLITSHICLSQAGSLDMSFGNRGIVRTDFTNNQFVYDNDGQQILLHPDGSFYLVFEMNQQSFVTHRLANGSLDINYGEGGYSVPLNMRVPRAVIQPNGKIVVGGTQEYPDENFALARLDQDGTLDNSFSQDGTVVTDFGLRERLYGIALQPDGKIVAVGSNYDQYAYIRKFALARYNVDGSLDSTFSGDGLQTTGIINDDVAYGVALQKDGKIVIAGTSNNGGTIRLAVARYLSNGTLDNSFSADGIQVVQLGWNSGGNCLAIQDDGKIIVGGYSHNIYNSMKFLLARFDTNGSLDNSFSNDGINMIDYGGNDASINAMVIQPDGKIVATGFASVPGYREFIVARYNTDGTADPLFSGDGVDVPNVGAGEGTPDESANGIALQSNGKIWAAGFYSYHIGFAVVCYNPDGSLDPSLDGDGILKDHRTDGYTIFYASTVQQDGKIIAVGTTGEPWTLFYKMVIVRYNTNGELDISFGSGGKSSIDFPSGGSEASAVAIQKDGKIVIAGTAYNESNKDFAVARLNTNGNLDSSFSGDGKVLTDIRGYDDGASGIVIQPDGKIVVSGFSNLWGADDDFATVRYNGDGSLDNSFSGDGKQTVDFGSTRDRSAALALQLDGKIVEVGTIAATATVANSNIGVVRLNNDGSIDASFGNNGLVNVDVDNEYDNAYSVALQDDQKIIVAGNSYTKLLVIRLNGNGSFDNSFSNGGKMALSFNSNGINAAIAHSVQVQADQKIIVGGTTNCCTSAEFVLVRLHKDGTLDSNFSENGRNILDLSGFEDDIHSISLNGNRIYAVGNTTYGGVKGVVAAFKMDEANAITVNCPVNKVSNTDSLICAAIINDIDPNVTPAGGTINYLLTGATIGSGIGSVSGFKFQKGATTVTYSIPNDPTKFCSFTIDVIDKEPPTVNYPFIQSLCYSNNNTYSLSPLQVSDNCGSINTVEYRITGATTRNGTGTNASGVFNKGTSAIDWRITDNAGNTNSFYCLIKVDEPVVVTIPDAYALPQGTQVNTVYRGYNSASFITLNSIASGGDGFYATRWSDGFTATWNTVHPTMPTTYTVTVTDLSGCTATATKNIYVTDIRCGEQRNKVQLCKPTNPGTQLLCVDWWTVPGYLANGAFLAYCSSELFTSIPPSSSKSELIESKLEVSPNPSPSEFRLNLRTESKEVSELIIRDQLGKVVERIRIKPNQNIIIGKSYRPGIYFAEVRLKDKKYTAKLIKQ